jgi:hypothetical protein
MRIIKSQLFKQHSRQTSFLHHQFDFAVFGQALMHLFAQCQMDLCLARDTSKEEANANSFEFI